jgi:hypothetical protein
MIQGQIKGKGYSKGSKGSIHTGNGYRDKILNSYMDWIQDRIQG